MDSEWLEGGVQVGLRRVALGEVTLNVAEAGPSDGAPVLFLHGFPDSWRLWRYQLAALASKGRRCVAPDLRGFGESDRPVESEAYELGRIFGDLTALCDAIGIERCDVVGHDWGAVLAWMLAALAPERVRHLAVLSVGHPGAFAEAGPEQRARSWYMLWFLFPGVAETVLAAQDGLFWRQWLAGGAQPGEDADVDRQVAELSRPGALVAALNWYRANISPTRFVETTSPLPPAACPVMGVWSSGDVALTEEEMTGSQRHVTGPWRYERVEGVDHWLPVHAAEQVNHLLVDFLVA